MRVLAWCYFALCELVALVVLFPLGLLLVGWCCARRNYTLPATSSPLSIKPLPQRTHVDTWGWKWMQPVYGNPEDGVTGFCAYGPSWTGAYNPTRSRWLAFVWSALRNWANGFGYLTWRWTSTAPLLVKAYSLFGQQRQLKIGWQQLPAADGWIGPYRCRMVCSA